MTAPVGVTIGGVAYPTTLETNFSISSVQGRTVSTFDGTIYDRDADLAVPQEAADIVVVRNDTAGRIFGGLTSMPTGRTEGLSRYWDIQAQSYTCLLDTILFYATYAPGFIYTNTAGQSLIGDRAILGHLFEKCVVGQFGATGGASEILVSPTYVQQGVNQLSSLNFVYQYAREAVEYFASLVNFDYYVDFYKYLHYYYRQTIAAPFSLSSTPGETLGGLTAIGYRNLKWKRDGTRIRNNYLVFGANTRSNIQYSIMAGNGSDLAFYVGFQGPNYPIAAPPGYDRIQVWVNTGTNAAPVWTAQTVGLTNIDDSASYDCMFDLVNQTLLFADAPPNFANAVRVGYTFTYLGGQPYAVPGSITKYGRTFSQRLVASDANTAVTMQTQLKNLQQQFGYGLQILTLSVDDKSFPAGNTNRFSVGQWVPFKNAILGINQSYWIHQITTKIIGGQLLEYALELRNWTT